ncbi:MAG: efflux transporter outer membrane subunit [Gammaproteobacteria bacterium]|nr:efflux transporter outer membrane subunit [Gammaproteobacteria bacterium]NBY22473.1 efflux transporter outer membrane subunit [Gammaproteobacteria bacterium]
MKLYCHRLLKALRLLLLFPLLGGCPVGPSYERPDMDPGKAFGNQDEKEYDLKSIDLLWWRQFKDQRLTQLIESAVIHNYDLKAAEANLRTSRALFLEAGLNLIPQPTTHTNWNSLQRSLAALNNKNYVPRNLDLYSIGFDAYWEVDIWGRIRRDVQSKEAEIEAAEANRRNLTLTIVAEVARNYFVLRGHQNQIAVERRNADNQKSTWDLTIARQEAGIGTEFDTQRAKAQYDTTLALIPPLDSLVHQDIHRLSVLTGQIPSALLKVLLIDAPIPQPPLVIHLSDPKSLLRRRPDIQEAERSLASATARIGVAMADVFPKVTFVGAFNLESNSLTGLAAPGTGAYNFGPRITWPAFDLGQVYARIKASEANADVRLAEYQQIVLNALEETENALVNYDRLRDRQLLLKTASEASLKAYDIANIRFEEGVEDFLNLLDTERRLLQDQREYAGSMTDTAAALISIYKSLGGGWETFQTEEDAKRSIEEVFTP